MTRSTEVTFQTETEIKGRETRNWPVQFIVVHVWCALTIIWAHFYGLIEREREGEKRERGRLKVKPGEAEIASQSEIPPRRLKGWWAVSRALRVTYFTTSTHSHVLTSHGHSNRAQRSDE